jgi:hypothetical protein
MRMRGAGGGGWRLEMREGSELDREGRQPGLMTVNFGLGQNIPNGWG